MILNRMNVTRIALLTALAFGGAISAEEAAKPAAKTASVPTPAPAPVANSGAKKTCEDVKAEIEAKIKAKIKAKGVKTFTLDIVPAADVKGAKVVGNCEAGSKKITYKRG